MKKYLVTVQCTVVVISHDNDPLPVAEREAMDSLKGGGFPVDRVLCSREIDAEANYDVLWADAASGKLN